jgi:outer membrane immunogenic protein
LRGEYLHLDLGRSNVTMADPAALPGVVATYGFSHVTDTVRVGVNHRFGPTSVVAKY